MQFKWSLLYSVALHLLIATSLLFNIPTKIPTNTQESISIDIMPVPKTLGGAVKKGTESSRDWADKFRPIPMPGLSTPQYSEPALGSDEFTIQKVGITKYSIAESYLSRFYEQVNPNWQMFANRAYRFFKKAGIKPPTGKVIILVEIDRQGRLASIRLLKGIDPKLDAAALDALKKIQQVPNPRTELFQKCYATEECILIQCEFNY